MPSFVVVRTPYPGIEAVVADTTRAFGRHTHDQYGIGLIERGAQRSASGRGPVEAGVGDLVTVNPGEVHDGVPIGDGGRCWRMLYLDPEQVAAVRADAAVEAKAPPAIEFDRPVLSRDTLLGATFLRLFRALTPQAVSTVGAPRRLAATGHVADRPARGGDCGDGPAAGGERADRLVSEDGWPASAASCVQGPADGGAALLADECLTLLLSGLLRVRPAGTVPLASGLLAVRERIDDDPGAALTLAALAAQAGLSRYQFLRGFARLTGLTPHAYLMQRRLHSARRRIAAGVSLAEVAAMAGFADQSHMTRLFVRSFGLPPGVYAAAMRR